MRHRPEGRQCSQTCAKALDPLQIIIRYHRDAWLLLELFFVLCAALTLSAQEVVKIRVDTAARQGPFKPVWTYFGYDEPNYTYMPSGRKLIGELAASSRQPVYFRAHNLLTTGDGTPALKWGSTNAYTENAAGQPVYDWTIVDRIFDTYLAAKAKPFVEIGFTPEALSTNPQPYKHNWSPGNQYNSIYTGWAYPPKDYRKWAELVYQWVRHSVAKYGRAEIETWYWEVWNEPDISYWKGTPEQFNELYDHAVDAVKRALPTAKVGGPATTGPASPKAAAFLKQFLEHCATGKNFATGKTGAPLDFITYHAKGSPKIVDNHVRMGISKNLQDVANGYEIVASFPQFKKLPIILSEADPEGCAACSARVYPHNAYRNGTMYPTYTAVVLKHILALAAKHGTNIEGMLSWSFEFEGQPYFDGFRSLATNGIDKPVLNVFRMAGMMDGQLARVESSSAAGIDAILASGIAGQPDIDALATRSDRKAAVLLWNYHDDDVPAPPASVLLSVNGLPTDQARVHLDHYRIDQTHSNAYSVWKQMGSPQQPTPEQYARLEESGQLQLLESPRWITSNRGSVEVEFSLPRHSVSLLIFSW